jgi:hypothetical protein
MDGDSLLVHSISGFGNRRDDAGISSATADVAIQAADDLGAGRSGIAAEKSHSGEHHPAGAVTALESAFLQKGFLDWVQFSILLESFNGGDFPGADGIDGSDTGPDGGAIHQHGASAALGFAAAVFGSGQLQVIPKDA